MQNGFNKTIITIIEDAVRNSRVQPLNLGGLSSGPGGSLGTPPGGFIGYLPQNRVSYDTDEAALSGITSGSGTLVDNLNHIRYRLNSLESGILVVDEYDGNPSVNNVNHITFSGGVIVTEIEPGHALVTVTASGGGGITYSGLPLYYDDLSAQVPDAGNHYDLAHSAIGTVMLFYNTTLQSINTFTMDVDNAGLTTSFTTYSGDTIIAVYGLANNIQYPITYSGLSASDGTTDVIGAELEELTDGSETALHSHAGGGGLVYNAITVTTSNVTAVSGNFYDATIAGLTANRDFNLPTPSVAGEKIGLRTLDGDATYVLIIKANGTEITRIFIAGETLEFMSYGTGAGDWKISYDGRIQSVCRIKNTTTQTISHNTDTGVVLDEYDYDNAGLKDNVNYRINIRRTNKYIMTAGMRLSGITAAAPRFQIWISDNNVALITIDERSANINTYPAITIGTTQLLTAGQWIELRTFQTTGVNQSTFVTGGNVTHLELTEVLT